MNEPTIEEVASRRSHLLDELIAELGQVQRAEPDEAVRMVAGMVANQDSPSNVRGRLSDIRALAALEHRLGPGSELSVAQFARQLSGEVSEEAGGMSVTRALFLVARGREVMARGTEAVPA